MNTAIIVAAGSGKRFGGEIPKQFLEIGGKAVLIYTLEKFENCAAVDEIILVLAADELTDFKRKLENYEFKKIKQIVAGGDSRAGSVLHGLDAVDEINTGIIAVHDGARPLVTSEEIAATIEKAAQTGAACLVGRVFDTIKEVSGGKIAGTINRENLRRALTPQCFRRAILQRAFEIASLNAETTDECALVEKLGVEISFVEGSAKNIKITTREDFEYARLILE